MRASEEVAMRAGLLKLGAAFLLGLVVTVAICALRLDVLPAAVAAFAGGCVAAYVSTPGASHWAELMSTLWLGGGIALGLAVAVLVLGVPADYFTTGAAMWVLVPMLAGFLVVAAPRTADEDAPLGRIVVRWRRRLLGK